MACHRDARIQPVFKSILVGSFCSSEIRRIASAWFRAGGIGPEFRRADGVLGSVGRKAEAMATTVLPEVEHAAAASDEAITLALDDTPSERYGTHVEGAGLHRNPTPGPFVRDSGSSREAAARLGISDSVVQVATSRVMKRLRQEAEGFIEVEKTDLT